MEILKEIRRAANASGKLIANAEHAAIAIEHDCGMVSSDSDFIQFCGLRWRIARGQPVTLPQSHPLGMRVSC